jgi:hypothetical protein
MEILIHHTQNRGYTELHTKRNITNMNKRPKETPHEISGLPTHLGGHGNRNHIDNGALNAICQKFSINSMLDVGCGLGEMKTLCDERSIAYLGIDGDYTVKRNHDSVTIHDYTQGKSLIEGEYDLGWSTEFLEHVEEAYKGNYMNDFSKCKYALVTHAPPGKRGYHHVNLKPAEYWISVFESYGFKLDSDVTQLICKESTLDRNFIREHGLFFVKA